MFPDSPTAQKFACRRTKTTHIVTQALAPHWDNKVTDMCKEEKFAVMIDESNDKGDNKKLNILVRVYNTTLQKIATHFVGIPTCNIVASLSDRFLSLSPDQKSQLEDQASDYILSPKSDLPPYDKENTTMNQFWQSMAQRKIPSGQPQFDLLFQLSKVMLTIPHSNADTERTFSMLKKIQTDSRDNLESKTIHSLLSIKINNYTDCYLYKPEPSLVRSAKSACTSYQSQCSTTSA
ncbi:unnamed protein product [Mytilus edulis]|uniref:HAT C-terminal dimerisation domain-containing protein n=1 Tax=Mytilus edulis TaxID=6550 RepID=A0A8S3RGE3_MYTED|nr:unnamed protein product [Mytilus edulis]